MISTLRSSTLRLKHFLVDGWVFIIFLLKTWLYSFVCHYNHHNSFWSHSCLSQGGSCHPHPLQRPLSRGKTGDTDSSCFLAATPLPWPAVHWHTIGSWPPPNTHPPSFLSDLLCLSDNDASQTSSKFSAMLLCRPLQQLDGTEANFWGDYSSGGSIGFKSPNYQLRGRWFHLIWIYLRI